MITLWCQWDYALFLSPDNRMLVTLWYRQNGVNGIRCVRLVRE